LATFVVISEGAHLALKELFQQRFVLEHHILTRKPRANPKKGYLMIAQNVEFKLNKYVALKHVIRRIVESGRVGVGEVENTYKTCTVERQVILSTLAYIEWFNRVPRRNN
jgi:hypothetical protein